ncbi:hypothetical protein L1987_04490 [Smallanthus sonchifolius]|uniref:Uncharacterized protein n=1 Tax=Smallanthus sonchifolius TaxID=185202 RepID=A0ACB9JSQ8_9ASTR|nr:hypothetical protein L1987_04490 [Smallanthus sonchifolius]
MDYSHRRPTLAGILEYQERKSMYPKVKVRQEEEDPPESLRIYFKNFQALSLYDHPSNSLEEKDGYTPAHMGVHISSPDAKISVKAGKVNRKVSEENKSNKKASSVLPPRAVLSSPENDAMHGTKNKNRIKTQEAGFKCQNTHVKCTKSYELEKRRRSWK